jgi:hypothetical protein
MTRREFTGGALATACLPGLAGCGTGMTAYDAALAEMTAPLPTAPEFADLVRYATLAANGHNTQPWTFAIQPGGAVIRPDFSRRTPVVDPDDHHLFASLGCAAENMALAARARGLSGEALFQPEDDGSIRIDLSLGQAEEGDLFAAIPARQCSRSVYDGTPVPPDVMRRLEAAARVEGVEVIFVTETQGKAEILDLVIAGNSRQMDDPAFLAELKSWLRFNAGEAAETRDGLYSASTGNPALPGWLGPIAFDWFFSKDAENEKYAEQIRSSDGIAVFVADINDKAGWIAAGRTCQRFALQTTLDGVKYAFINQAVEEPEVRRDLQNQLGLGERRPNLVVRFGYGPEMPRSLRRRPADVMAV